MKYTKRAISTPQIKHTSFKGETVESIVDKYRNEWDYSYEETLYEINNNFEMSEEEKEKAMNYLKEQTKL